MLAASRALSSYSTALRGTKCPARCGPRAQRSYCQAKPPIEATPEKKTLKPAMSASSMQSDGKMLITTSSFLYGRKIVREVALVSGSSVRAKNLIYDILSRVSGLFGWEVTFYGSLLSQTSAQAAERMIAEAAALGADAIIDVKFTMSSTSDPTAGVFVYTMAFGTAVITKPHKKGKRSLAKIKSAAVSVSSTASMPNNPL